MKQRKYGILFSYSDLISHIIIGILITPFMINYLGKQQYGLYALAMSIAGYLLIMDFGISSGIVRFLSKYKAQKDEKSQENFLSIILILYLLISILIIVISLILKMNLPLIFERSLSANEIDTLSLIFYILILNLIFSMFSNAFSGILKSCEKFPYIHISNTIRRIIRVSLIILCLSLGYGIITIILIEAITNILHTMINTFYVLFILKIKIKLHRIKNKEIRSIFRYSFFIFLIAIADAVYWKIDNIILGIMTDTETVAIYSIGSRICHYFMRFCMVITGVLFPKIVRITEENASPRILSNILLEIGRIQTYIVFLLASGFVLFGRNFIELWVGIDFEMAYYTGIIIMIPLSVFMIQALAIHILKAKDRHYFHSITLFIISVLNIMLTIILVKYTGMIGAAIGTGISILTGNILILNIYYHRALSLDIPGFYKNITGGIIAPLSLIIIPGYVLSLLRTSTWFIFFLQLSIYTILYIILCFFIMNPREKKLFFHFFY